jgi:hypothetical protein
MGKARSTRTRSPPLLRRSPKRPLSTAEPGAAAGEAQERERRAAEESRARSWTQIRSARKRRVPARCARAVGRGGSEAHGGQAAYDSKTPGRAVGIFEEAATLYDRAERASREVRQRERRRAELARELAQQGQRSAESVGAEHRAVAL